VVSGVSFVELHTYMYTYIHVYIHTCIHTYMYTYIHAYIITYIAVPWLRWLVTGLSPRRPGSVRVGFVVDKVAQG
jgi:hypothetical protein